MATTEEEIKNRLDKHEAKLMTLEQQVSNVVTKLDMFIEETRENRARQDEDMRELRTKMDSNIKNMFITVVIGIGAMVVAVLLK